MTRATAEGRRPYPCPQRARRPGPRTRSWRRAYMGPYGPRRRAPPADTPPRRTEGQTRRRVGFPRGALYGEKHAARREHSQSLKLSGGPRRPHGRGTPRPLSRFPPFEAAFHRRVKAQRGRRRSPRGTGMIATSSPPPSSRSSPSSSLRRTGTASSLWPLRSSPTHPSIRPSLGTGLAWSSSSWPPEPSRSFSCTTAWPQGTNRRSSKIRSGKRPGAFDSLDASRDSARPSTERCQALPSSGGRPLQDRGRGADADGLVPPRLPSPRGPLAFGADGLPIRSQNRLGDRSGSRRNVRSPTRGLFRRE